jgi:hypothetical protein
MRTSGLSRRAKRQRRERIFALLALILIVAFWIVGSIRAESGLLPAVQQAMPDADHVVREQNGLYSAWAKSSPDSLLGYVALGEADGYGGPFTMAVAVNLSGEVVGTAIADHKETPAWMDRVMKSDLLESLPGKTYSDPFVVDEDLDSVTGATASAKAIAEAVLTGSQAVARHLGLPVEPPSSAKIVFGFPEIVLIALFVVGYIGHQQAFKYKKQTRWVSMLVGLIVLGFIYNSPLTLAYITKLILGYWPRWQTNLYWYFLIGGIFLVFTVDNKNPYCEWFCPFGAAQECMAVIGGAKTRRPRRYYNWLKWLPRVLSLAAILLGVYFRNPGLSSYEVFGALFSLVGGSLMLAILALVLIASLFIKRPWCDYLCPIKPVVTIIRVYRDLVKEAWQKINPRKKIA